MSYLDGSWDVTANKVTYIQKTANAGEVTTNTESNTYWGIANEET